MRKNEYIFHIKESYTIIIKYLRSSSCGTWKICPQQFFLSYTLGIPQTNNKKAEMGTILHKVMETFANAKLAIQNNHSIFKDDAIGDVDISNIDIMSGKFINNIFNRAYAYYSIKSVHDFSDGDYSTINEWMDAVIDFQNGMFDPRKREIVAAEPHFDFEITEDWAKYKFGKDEGRLRLKGTIDLVTKINDDTYELIDWKTGQRKDWATGKVKEFEDLCKDTQLRIYYYAMTKMYPEIKNFIITIYFVRDGGPFTMAYTKEDIESTMQVLKQHFTQIKSTTRPQLKSSDPNYWFCKRVCHYGKTPHPKDPSKTICQYINEKTKLWGINSVVASETYGGHNVGHYQNPGS